MRAAEDTSFPDGPTSPRPAPTAPPASGRPRLERLRTADGRELPPIVLGTSALGSLDPTGLWGARARRRALRVLDDAFEAGCRALDLARSYRAGGTERVVGEWLRFSGCREELFLVSKIGHPIPFVAPNRLSTSDLERDLAQTLSSLGVDRLDLLMLHRDHPAAGLARVAEDLDALRRSGRTRFVGVSNWRLERIQALDVALGRRVVDASSPQFSLVEWKKPLWAGSWSISGRRHRWERRQYARARLATFAYCPLGRGVLGRSPSAPRAFRLRINEERRRRCLALAAERGVTTAQIAIAYLLGQPFPVFPVVGVRRREHMAQNLAATRLRLGPEEARWLEMGDVG